LTRTAFETIIDSHPQLVYKVMRAVARSAHRIVHRMNTEFVELSKKKGALRRPSAMPVRPLPVFA
jgi:hypothetical protein